MAKRSLLKPEELALDRESAPFAMLHERLHRWFDQSARPLPWRATTDPYAIWLSEVILQQTQVVQGTSYYHRFLELFPDVYALAAASEDEVLHAWQGLGYYSRGRNLLRAAQMIVADFGGRIPDKLSEIKRLPGVGPYTQAAILSFAYNLPYAAVDGNVYRVLSRLYADSTPIDTPQGQRHYRALAEALLDRNNPGKHNQAMIELGALVCTPRRADCPSCPLEAFCLAQAQSNPTAYPIKAGKTKVSNRYLNYILVQLADGRTLIERRGKGDIWQGLYQFPLIETDGDIPSIEYLFGSEPWDELLKHLTGVKLNPVACATRQHRLTHRLLHTRLFVLQAEAYTGSAYTTIARGELEQYALPALLTKLLDDAGLAV